MKTLTKKERKCLEKMCRLARQTNRKYYNMPIIEVALYQLISGDISMQDVNIIADMMKNYSQDYLRKESEKIWANMDKEYNA